jgi:hypothetical protein
MSPFRRTNLSPMKPDSPPAAEAKGKNVTIA